MNSFLVPLAGKSFSDGFYSFLNLITGGGNTLLNWLTILFGGALVLYGAFKIIWLFAKGRGGGGQGGGKAGAVVGHVVMILLGGAIINLFGKPNLIGLLLDIVNAVWNLLVAMIQKAL